MSRHKLDHWIVYGLCDPRDGQTRYVGVTSYRLHHRLSRHLHEVRVRDVCASKAAWIAELASCGLRPEICELESAWSASDAEAGEQFFVGYLRALGADLLNATLGGAGSVGRAMSAATREALCLANTGRRPFAPRPPISEETRARLRAAAARREPPLPRTEEYRQKLRDAWTRRRARALEAV